MVATVKFCCVFFIAVVLAAVAHGEHTCVPHVHHGGGYSRQCPTQLERERAKQNINDCIRNTLGISQPSTANCGPGLWIRVAYLNMSDSSQQCPSTWSEYNNNGLRACGRPQGNSGRGFCSSVNFTSNSHQYRKVCGQVIGYQIGSTDVFANRQYTIDQSYVDGVSITHGQSRTHIWTYAAGLSDRFVRRNEIYSCPCLVAGSSFTPQTPPSYVGNNYYCESGNPNSTFEHTNSLVYTSDLLWDGQQCEGQCCSNGNSPPWFSVDLLNPTSDDIEVRICGTEVIANEDTPIKLLELYIQPQDVETVRLLILVANVCQCCFLLLLFLCFFLFTVLRSKKKMYSYMLAYDVGQ